MLRRLFPAWSAIPKSAVPTRRNPSHRRLLGFERLEAREVPSVTLADISEPQIPSDKPMYVPVTVTNTPNGPVAVTASSDNSGLTAEVVSGGQSVRFDVTGTDSNGNPFSGSITIRLFADAAPNAAQRIIDLVNSGYYVGKLFPRVLDGFVIQGGGSSTSDNSPLASFADEFNPAYTFDSRGLLAMANSGDDTNNSQFFITDIDLPVVGATSTDKTRPQSLNFNYSIVGILTDGFDIYQKIITTPVSNNGAGEVSSPNSPVTITGATVFTDTENAVVKLTPQGNFTGTANITVTGTDADGAAGQGTKTFAVQGVDDGVNSPPFITTPVPNQTTTAGTPVTFTVPVTDIDGDATTIVVRDATFANAPANVSVSINQATGQVTITPNAGFTGTVQFKIGVRQTNATDTAANYDTQLVTLTVTANSSGTPTPPNTGPFTVEGSAPGAAATVTVRNSDGSVRFTVPVFGAGFTGGVEAASGDINGDGVDDVVVVPGQGGGGLIYVLDSTTGQVFRQIRVFEPSFRGGLHLFVGDVNGLGYDQVLVGAGVTGGPRVTLLDLKLNKQLLNFIAGDENSRGGVDVTAGEVFQGKGQMIVTGSGPGAAGTVSVYQAADTILVGSFSAGDTTGIQVRLGDTLATATTARSIFVKALNAPTGTTEQEFDPSKFMDPNNPVGKQAASSSGSSSFDINSLINQAQSQ